MFIINESELNTLVLNVVNENLYSHCRLCLTMISEQYVRFHDFVSIESSGAKFSPLPEFLQKALFGVEISEHIAGLDAVCLNCVDRALEVVKFVEMCQHSSQLLNKVFHKLLETINYVEIDTTNNQSMFIEVTEEETNIMVMKKDEKKDEQEKGKVRRTLKLRRKRKLFECYKCNESLHSLDDFKAHNLCSHSLLTCDLCSETFSSSHELETHLNSIHKYQCSQCSQRMNSEDELKDHVSEFHNTYVCKECGIACQGLEKLWAHEQKHNVSKQKCPKCGKSYSTKDFYLKHVKLCLEDQLDPHPHRNEIVKTFLCNLCGKGYSTQGGLRVHYRFAHENAKPHACNVCGKEFTAPSYLKTHMVKHTGERNFKCDICTKKFVSKEALLYHTRRHTGEKPYSCKICSETFVNASARAEHIKFKHVGPTLMCEICSHKFVTPNFLRQHMSRHHDRTSKLYVARTLAPDMPGEENKKIKYEN